MTILSSSLFSQSISIRLVFESGFSTSFQSGQPWQNVNEQDVKDFIFSRVYEDYAPYGLPVSLSSGNLIAYIGRTGSGFGLAVSGLGSYIDGNAYCEIYSNTFNQYSEWQGSNATVSRVGEAIAGTVSHELAHLLNLYHAYMFDSFNPTISGALYANYQPKEPDDLPVSCKTDAYKHYHIMATLDYITLEQRATINRYWGTNESQVLNFAKLYGSDIGVNTTWGISGKSFYQQNNIDISSGKTFYVGSGGCTHYLNGHTIRGGSIVKVGTVIPQNVYLKNGSTLTGILLSVDDALSKAVSNETIETYINYTNSNHVNLPQNVNFLAKSGITINLNGFHLKTNGGYIIDEGATWLPNNIKIMYGSTIRGYYSTLQDALNNFQSGETMVISTGSYTLSQNLSIPSGSGLTLNSGVAISCSAGLTINGTLTTNGATLTFGSGSGLTVNGTLNATNTTFTGSGWTGINLNGANYPSLQNCTVSNASYGVNTYNCYSQIRYSRIIGAERGANYTTYGQGDIGPSCVFDWNNWDVRGDNTSVPSPGGSIAGYISFRNPGYYQVYSEYGGAIQAAGNYWMNGPLITGNVNASNPLQTDPNPRINETEGIIAHPEFKKSSTPVSSITDNGIKELDEARLLMDTKNYESAMNKFKIVADKYYNETSGRIALVFIEHILDKTNRQIEKLNLLNTYELKAGKLASFAAYRKGYIHYRNGEYEKALDVMKDATFANDDTEMEKIRLYDMGTINYACLDKKTEGLSYLNDLVKKYPTDELSKLAMIFYGAEKVIKDEEKESSDLNTNFINKTELFANYPNPFNPTTVIKYNLAENTNVTLKVYDILGREVKTLVSEFKPKGYYEVKFDGRGLSSGLYFYQLKAGNTNQLLKMILTK